jgi:hypothetical protein
MVVCHQGYGRAIAALIAGVLVCSAATCAPAFGAPGENLVTNPGAETGNLEGWTGSGFGVAQYDSSPSAPSQAVAAYDGLGSRLFRGEQAGAKLTQTVPLADLAATIDAGQQPLSIGADLGGAGSGPDGMELLMQPQGASGEPLGPPVQLGPPTATDRKDEATMLVCYATITAPVGTRSALITLLAVGNPGTATTANADNIWLDGEGELASESILYGGPPIEGAHCKHRIILPPEPKPGGPPPSSSGPSPCANSARTHAGRALIATALPRGTTPAATGTTPAATPPPSPCDTNKQEVASVSRLRLTRGHLSLQISGAGTVDIVVAQEHLLATHAKRSARGTWHKMMRFSLHATAAGVVSRSLHRLKPGRYRVTATVIGSKRPVAITTRLRG